MLVCVLFRLRTDDATLHDPHFNYNSVGLLDDLSQITCVLDDMSQKGSICTKIIRMICHNFFSTWTICHTFILDDLSQVIFVKILFWTICHKTYNLNVEFEGSYVWNAYVLTTRNEHR